MPRNEDGELELILGKTQLLSVFFLVVILLGVFFTMGYIVGRNSLPEAAASASKSEVAQANKGEVTGSTAASKPEIVIPPVGSEKKAEKESAMPRAEEKAPAPEPSASKGEAEPPKPPASPARPPEVSAVSASRSGVVEPGPGMYMQVVAVPSAQAEPLVKVLTSKGFKAFAAPGPSEAMVRVLVGPVGNNADLGRLKGDLEQAGFKGAFPKKY